MITFFIPGEPVAKGRARSFIRNGRIGHYTPEKTESYELRVALGATAAMGGIALLTGPLVMSVKATFSIPKSWTKKRREAHVSKPEAVIKKPDLDNILKSVADGMNGVVYADDAQISEFSECKKVYGDMPGVLVKVWEAAP